MPATSLVEIAPFDRHYGLELLPSNGEVMRGVVPVRPELTQPLGMVHGGVYAAIAEALASLGTNRAVVEAGSVGLGQTNSCSFIKPISDGSIHATARARHRGASTWVWDVEMSDDAGNLCVLGRVAVAVRRQRTS